ncbi:G patch domain-containing protein 4 [Cataglyphis hispanica]|uniref:G patch domain-containing protein 4 n=1 Tax=Cataglyphis hispanica TaxID=1086592 RepID=UPI00217F910E|nr:G patch domain-containing protein 4 [Cataglyphis hispanica]
MANFAKTQLLKYGWKEGKGLGKNENGLTEALRPMLKFDNAGIGYNENSSEHWWEALYDNAAKNIKVELHDNEVSLSTINNSNIIDAWNTVSSKKSKKTEQQKYGNFLKTSTLHNGCLIQETSIEKEEETAKNSIYIPLSDEQLYKACNGRTAGHDLTLNGKLARIAQQDRIFLDVNIGSVYQLDTSLVKKNTMTHRKTDVELDTEESEDPEDLQEIVDDQNTSEHETKDFVIRSKSARKSHKKRINKCIQQFSICSLKGKTDAEDNSLHDGESAKFKKEKEYKSQLNIKSGKCSKKKKKNRRKRSFEQEIQRNVHNILYKTSDIQDKLKYITEDVYLSKSKKFDLQQKMYIQRSPFTSSSNDLNDKVEKDIGKILLSTDKKIRNIQQQIQEQATWTSWKYFDVGERDFKPSMKKFYSLYYDKLDTSPKISFYKSLSISSTKDQSHINNSDDKLHNKDKKIKKKAHQQKQVKKQLEKVINPVNFCTDDLNTVIKKLTTFDLTEKVSANALKKKLTQTHLTPV